MEKSTIALIGGIVIATAFAFAYGSRQSPAAPLPAPEPQAQGGGMVEPDPNVDPNAELPPGHPPIGDQRDMAQPHDMPSAVAPSEDDSAALTWKAPASWTLVPNPNAMRLATYKVVDGTEMIVARAGGDVDGNVKRWVGQFDESYSLRESHKTVHGLKVTLVQIDGVYLGGGMTGDAGAHAGWSMLAAIVETKGQPYFFKLVGPSGAVQSATKPFETMIDGVTPS